MNLSRKKHNRITKHNRIAKRRYNRISAITVITTVCIIVTSISVIAAPMKQDTQTAQKKVSLPGAGINKVVSDYVEAANESDISVLASDIVKIAEKSEKSDEQELLKQVKVNSRDELSETIEAEDADVFEEYVVSEEPVSEEPVYEEPVYEEPVYEEEYIGDAYNAEEYIGEPDQIFYEEETFIDVVLAEDTSEPVYEEPVYEEPIYEEPVYEEETLEQFLEEQDAAIADQAEERETQAAQEEAAAQSASGAALGQTIANDACQYVGWLPYVWAGDSLEYGADCSGFTMAVYAKYGYYLSHDSEVQSCEGRSVPLSEAQPGDIIVYSGHVGMYIGDGMVVHSPHPGTVVSIDSVYMMPVLDVRRIID